MTGDPRTGGRFAFGEWEIDTGAFRLRRGTQAVHVEPQVFEVLAYLVRNHDRVVSKDELMDRVWGGRFVTESAVTSRVKAIRKALDDDGRRQHLVRTVRGRGYQLAVPVVVLDPAEPGASADAAPGGNRAANLSSADGGRRVVQQIGYTTAADGVRIAYATAGDGPALLKAANWMSHLVHDWVSPVWRHWLGAFSQHHTLVRYDGRGCGLSDPVVGGFDDWIEDLERVAEAAGVERSPLLGISQGAAVAVAYAVRHPERVSSLLLVGGYARGRLVRADTATARREAELDVELARVGWGRDDVSFRQVFTTQFLPDATKEQWDAFDELQRRTASPRNAVEFLEAFARIDISAIAGLVACPTLVVHSRRDRRVPLSQAEELARLIPGSRMLVLDSANHLLTADERAWTAFGVAAGGFLAGEP